MNKLVSISLSSSALPGLDFPSVCSKLNKEIFVREFMK